MEGNKMHKETEELEVTPLGKWIHILGFLFTFLVPLIIYFIVKDEDKFDKANVKSVLNFRLTILIIGAIITALFVISTAIVFIVFAPIYILLFVGYVLAILGLGLFSLIATIISAFKAFNGEVPTYPGFILIK